ncbi:DUF4232 domain-containing protein [Streptomyces sp. C1-2]|uniref:DUF4232 domain-containing protein n=1 Tax=Streptomyces sp. C1-2 TaxID=2720022 RepID=UPI0014327835|nr:DUF4232 domain-containing protein [Streptomyces sp. C1-2]NJP69900.1 DUF4232 domain-containing protein [Streptomyces sp. C1-2]
MTVLPPTPVVSPSSPTSPVSPARRPRRSSALRRAATVLAVTGALGLVAACGSDDGSASSPQTLSGTAGPASGDSGTAPGDESTTASPGGGDSSAGATTPGRTDGTKGTSNGDSSSAGSARCHTSELSAALGPNHPGAGQENFAVVLTNTAHRTCTLRGYPGAAFTDASGKQLGPDPVRTTGDTAKTIRLTPGHSAWAGLSFSNPEVSEARAATPASLLVTPPDERDHLSVRWTGGKVPVSGNASSVRLTALRPGTGD